MASGHVACNTDDVEPAEKKEDTDADEDAAMSGSDLPPVTFSMRTTPGDRRVSRLVERVMSKTRSRREVVIMLRTGLMSIERRFPDVRSDVVRDRICGALDEYCRLASLEPLNNSEF